MSGILQVLCYGFVIDSELPHLLLGLLCCVMNHTMSGVL